MIWGRPHHRREPVRVDDVAVVRPAKDDDRWLVWHPSCVVITENQVLFGRRPSPRVFRRAAASRPGRRPPSSSPSRDGSVEECVQPGEQMLEAPDRRRVDRVQERPRGAHQVVRGLVVVVLAAERGLRLLDDAAALQSGLRRFG